jgi:hypothetical protein
MAKAKKPESKSDTKPEAVAASKAPAKAAAAKKKSAPAKTSSPAAAPGMPLIDTSLAAENAAKQLVAGVSLKSTGSPATGSRPESSMFKQLKSGLNKPHAAAMNNLLDKTHGPTAQKSGQSFGPGSKQVGHNQTFGADANRTGVPRRTSG